MDKIILKFLWKGKATRISKITFKKNNKMEEITLPIPRLITELEYSKLNCVCSTGRVLERKRKTRQPHTSIGKQF